MDRFLRTEMLIGEEGLCALSQARVAVFGAGGVGCAVIEALARSGVGAIDIIDNDSYSKSNLNRQLFSAPELVGFVERGQVDSEECVEYLETILEPYADHKVDAVVLGCTHFPFARKQIQKILGEEVLVFEGSMGAAKQCQRLLGERGLLNDSEADGTISFENSDESKIEQCIAMFGYTDV